MAAKSSRLQWVSLVGVIWLQSINGTNSNFPAYSTELKQQLSLSQLQLNNLALASDAGKLFGCFAGMAAIYLPLWLLLLIGSTLGLIGYGFQYLLITHQITSLPYSLLFFLSLLAGNGICWINTVCYLVTIQNFPFHRQAAVGLTTSYLGLSPVIYTAFVDAFSSTGSTPLVQSRAQHYMLFNSILPLLVSFMTAPFMRSVDTEKATRVETGFVVLFMITTGTGMYAVLSNLRRIPMRSSAWFNMMAIGVCLALPLLVPLAECFRYCIINSRERRVCEVTPEPEEEAENFKNNRMKEDDNSGEQKRWAIEEIGVKLMVKRLNFWLYFLIYLFGATLGLVYLNNLGQIADSRGYSKTSSLVLLASTFVFLGRLLPSLVDYAYSRRKMMVAGGPGWIAAAMVPMSGAFFLLRDGSSVSLHVSTAIIGFCTGSITAISVSTTTELFGVDHFGVNHNVVVVNIPVGSFLFGGVAAVEYSKQGDGNGRCMGLQCYDLIFIIWGFISLLGTALALLLHFRTRKFYLQLRS